MAGFYELQSCCTGMVLAYLGNDKQFILDTVRDSRSFRGYSNSLTHAVVIATTTERQGQAKEALAEIGFTASEPFVKNRDRGSRELYTGGITVHTIHAHALWDWILAARTKRQENIKAERARAQEIMARRRFGTPVPIADGVRTVPSCTIRRMKRDGYIPNHFEGWNDTRINTHVLDQFPDRYGLTEAQYEDCLRDHSIGMFAETVRIFQRQNQAQGAIRIVRD